MLTLTSPHDTWAHRLPAAPKMVALALWTVALFSLNTLPPLLAAPTATGALILSGGLPFARTSALMLRPLWPFVLIVALWQGWLGDPTWGAAPILRLITAVAAANFVTMTTRLSDMITILTTLARPLASLGLPPRRLALALALVLRFIPVMLHQMQTIHTAFRARSHRRPGWRVMVPTLLAALDDADHVAEALRARGGTG